MIEFLDLCSELQLTLMIDFLKKKIKVNQGVVTIYENDFSFDDYRSLDCDLFRVARLLKKRYGLND